MAVTLVSATHNMVTVVNDHSVEFLMTGRMPDALDYKFSFGQPVATFEELPSDARFTPKAQFAIYVGSTFNANHGFLVYIPGRGNKPFPRADVRDLKLILRPTPALELGTLVKNSTFDDITFEAEFVSIVPDRTDVQYAAIKPQHYVLDSLHDITSPSIPQFKEAMNRIIFENFEPRSSVVPIHFSETEEGIQRYEYLKSLKRDRDPESLDKIPSETVTRVADNMQQAPLVIAGTKMSDQFKYHYDPSDYQQEMELGMFRPDYDHGNGISSHQGMVRQENRHRYNTRAQTRQSILSATAKTEDDHYIRAALLLNADYDFELNILLEGFMTGEHDCESFQAAAGLLANQYLSEKCYRTVTEPIFQAFATKRKIRDMDNPTLHMTTFKDQDWDRWYPIMVKEMDQLRQKEVYDEIEFEDIPLGVQILDTKMDLVMKSDPTTNAKIKDKARLVVLGNFEAKTNLYTYAPTGNEKTFKTLIQISTIMDYTRYSFDFVGAFLDTKLKEPKYVRLPEAFNVNGKRVYWKLKKALYGMREAPYLFTEDCLTILQANGWSRSIHDPAVFTKLFGDHRAILYTHSDDEFLATKHPYVADEIIKIMGTQFEVKVNYNVESYIGYSLHKWKDGSITLLMPKSVSKLIAHVPDCPVRDSVLPASFNDAFQDTGKLLSQQGIDSFRQRLGEFIWISKIHPEMAVAIHYMSARVGRLTDKDPPMLDWMTGYLKKVQFNGLTYTPGTAGAAAAVIIITCCDAAFDVHRDSKSQTGYAIRVGDHSLGETAIVICKSSKQSTTQTSSTGAEAEAALQCVQDVVWLRGLLDELGFPQTSPTKIYADNQPMITVATNISMGHKRLKHVIRTIHYLMEQVKNGVIEFIWTASKQLTADALTKVLGPTEMEAHRPGLIGPTNRLVHYGTR